MLASCGIALALAFLVHEEGSSMRKEVTFKHRGRTYVKPLYLDFPVVVYDYPDGEYTMRPATPEDHYYRVKLAWEGKWKKRYQIGRDSSIKPWPFEFTHALKNAIVEEMRYHHVWNRKNRSRFKPDGYVYMPEDNG